MLVAGAMVAMSVFFVFRPLQPSRIQPSHPTPAATRCAARPEARSLRNTVARNHDPDVVPALLDGGPIGGILPRHKKNDISVFTELGEIKCG